MISDLETLAPGMLIASPSLNDPNFEHTVILVCVHNDQGAMGLVVNRPAPVTMNEILRQIGIKSTRSTDQAALVGGPVSLESGLLIYQDETGESAKDGELDITNQLRLCPHQELLYAISAGKGPRRYNIFLGHSGWGPGQLEREIAKGSWIPAAVHPDLLFETPPEDRWEYALRAEGLTPGQIGSFRPQN